MPLTQVCAFCCRFYVRDKKDLVVNAPYVDCSYKYAGGGMLSTAPDLVRFGNAMLYSYQFPAGARTSRKGQMDGAQQNSGNEDNKSESNSKRGAVVSDRNVADAEKAGKTSRGGADSSNIALVKSQNTNSKDQTLRKMDDSSSMKDETSVVLQGVDDRQAKGRRVGSAGKPGYLKSSTMQTIWAPVKLAPCDWDKDGFYAMGWAVVPEKQNFGCGRHQRFYISHTGGAVGASSVLLILPPPRSEESSRGSNLGAPPKGVVVAMIVNLISVSLCKTALEIAKVFEQVRLD